MVNILFLGDIVGRSGRQAVRAVLPELVDRHKPNLVVANGENAAGGLGINPKVADELFSLGIDVLTTGNHVWHHREVFEYLSTNQEKIIRPFNYPEAPAEAVWPKVLKTPGRGWTKLSVRGGVKVGVLNLIGRVFVGDILDCPFRAADAVMREHLHDCAVVFVDFHAEATSEKAALAFFLDGRVSAVVGTHTHVQTADARILPQGTAFITDVGMCGPQESIIGMRTGLVVERFLVGRSEKFDVAKGPCVVNAVVVKINEENGKAAEIMPIYEHV